LRFLAVFFSAALAGFSAGVVFPDEAGFAQRVHKLTFCPPPASSLGSADLLLFGKQLGDASVC
jgi:hypothetical protein